MRKSQEKMETGGDLKQGGRREGIADEMTLG